MYVHLLGSKSSRFLYGPANHLVEALKKRVLMNRRGIENVIAAVILVAIAVGAAAAVGYYMYAMMGRAQRVETLDVSNQKIYQMPDSSYKVYMTIYNKGSVDSQITSITVYDETGTGNAVSITEGSTVLKPGEGTTIQGTVSGTYTIGHSYRIEIRTETGKTFVVEAVCEKW